MKISTVLDKVDSGDFALPEFQRGYVWTRDQVRGFFQSLYRGYPIGGFLTWSTKARTAATRGGASDKDGSIQLLLDGQQRVTTLYGVLRGKPPRFFEGQTGTLSGLRFHMRDENFEFYAPAKMRDNPAWIDVTSLMQGDPFDFVDQVMELAGGDADLRTAYLGRLNRLHQVSSRDVHIEEVTGDDKSIDVVVEIFNRVNSGGTKLSKGDLALAAICAHWPAARDTMNGALGTWSDAGFEFKLDWLLRNANAVLTGEALFTKLADVPVDDFKGGLDDAIRMVSHLLNTVGGRLGLDHDRVLAGRGAFPVMSRMLHQHGGRFPNADSRDKLIYWYVHSFLWGRYAGATETALNQDLAALDEGGTDALVEQLRLSHGDLVVRPEHFIGQTKGARFYPLLYLLTRVHEAKDFSSGIPLKANMLGRHSSLQVHHIFPKARLAEADYPRNEINAVANFCFLTQDTNLQVGARDPQDYLEEIETRVPGALASQWIPLDRDLWRVHCYRDFLAARRESLANAANRFLDSLRDGTAATAPLADGSQNRPAGSSVVVAAPEDALPGVSEIASWLSELGMSRPTYDAEVPDPRNGKVMTVAAAFWPQGLQQEAGHPVVLAPDPDDTDQGALESSGYQIFHTPDALRAYVERLRAQQAGEQPWSEEVAAL
ncbi:GmrSD restriction endonuclease domain-containing protein [Streptomyces sp. 8N616]|uniref:GmrSD restriction endonuclease domain-containing protein n=1 Tax=Streptomyces sp. 8N616 TaxID=3457414 RepID=UPI003FD6B9D7